MFRKWGPALPARVAVLIGATAPASAAGGRMAPVQDRYEPGQTARIVGYTAAPPPGAVVGEPFYAYLRPEGEPRGAPLLDSDLYLGELIVEQTPHPGHLQLRVSLAFEVPEDLVPGEYEVFYCDDPCSERLLGDLVPSPLSIGVDPARRVIREWPLDEPEIANLPPAALLVGSDFQTTVADLRARLAPRPTTSVAAVLAAPHTTVAVVPAPASEDMAWPLPTALVLASAALTALVLSRRRPGPPGPLTSATNVAAAERRTGGAAAGRG